MRQLTYLLERIENYKDKAESIENIALDAELVYTIAAEKIKDEEKKKIYEEKLVKLQKMMEQTPFGMDIYELKAFWDEIKHRSYRDKITLNRKKYSLLAIRKFFFRTYQNIRYDLLNSVFRNTSIGASGTQPVDNI